MVFEFVLRSVGYCSTRREADSEKGRVMLGRSRMGDRIIVLRNMFGGGGGVCLSFPVAVVAIVDQLLKSSGEKS